MIVWLNGTFGAGKTTTARELVSIIPEARLFDPEQVGVMLRHVPDLPPVEDFQDWPPWRGLVVETARRLLAYVGGVLVVPQTVLVEKYWAEIRARLERSRIPVHHVVLHTDQATLTRRIEEDTADPEARQWRLDHLPDYLDALPWLIREGKVVDTTLLSPSQVAHAVGLQVGGSGRQRAASRTARAAGAAGAGRASVPVPAAPPVRTGVRRAGGRVRRASPERLPPERPLTGRSLPERRLPERSFTERPHPEHPLPKRPFPERSLTEQPFPKRPLPKRSLTEQPFTERSRTERSLTEPIVPKEFGAP